MSEVFQVKAYAPGIWLPPVSIGDSIRIPISEVQPFAPFRGKSWNLDAEPFVPSQWVACCTDWESLFVTVCESHTCDISHISPGVGPLGSSAWSFL